MELPTHREQSAADIRVQYRARIPHISKSFCAFEEDTIGSSIIVKHTETHVEIFIESLHQNSIVVATSAQVMFES